MTNVLWITDCSFIGFPFSVRFVLNR